ncbi:MAG: FHA domain-containing protein [Vicinamibacterales bacterium]|nr:FHA domain-containing protein [Vicinamibacterales bacterium]
MWILETDGAAPGRMTFRIPEGSVKTIGRSTGAEFMVDAALVSRLHCQLSATGGALHVKDLDSTNGTFVNGKRVASAELQDGDRLAVGRVELKVSHQSN